MDQIVDSFSWGYKIERNLACVWDERCIDLIIGSYKQDYSLSQNVKKSSWEIAYPRRLLGNHDKKIARSTSENHIDGSEIMVAEPIISHNRVLKLTCSFNLTYEKEIYLKYRQTN